MTLPGLRQELSVHLGRASPSGAPGWVIRDPIRGKFFALGWPAFEVLKRWEMGDPERIAADIEARTPLCLRAEDVAIIDRFLRENELVHVRDEEEIVRLRRRAERSIAPLWERLAHNYLFFRIPLWAPERFLDATLGAVRWLGGRGVAWATAFAFLLGAALFVRDSAAFSRALTQSANLSGLSQLALALILVKTAHELAHGYTARRFGVRVPVMGVAFMVLWPVLYTDVGETWLLRDRRARLAIVAAGVRAELTIAAWSTLAWSLSPPGDFRDVAFLFATVTWVSSLAINLNPFMRFDGYFLLMDWLDEANLFPRANALARWRLRELLFGLGEPPPEALGPGRRRAFVAYAWFTWIYRFFLFLGIALLVYHIAFKALGALLFALEIWWFILRPILNELRAWRSRFRAILGSRRAAASVGCAAFLVVAFSWPWQDRVLAPASLGPARVSEIFLHAPAKLVEVQARSGDQVREGDVLFLFRSDDLELRLALAHVRSENIRADLAAALRDASGLGRAPILREELGKAQREVEALEKEQSRLAVRAPMSGSFVDVARDLVVGQTYDASKLLGTVIAPDRMQITAFLDAEALERMDENAPVGFIDTEGARVGGASIARIDPRPSESLPDPTLAARNGGPIPTTATSAAFTQFGDASLGGEPFAKGPLTRVIAEFTTDRVSRGRVGEAVFHAAPESLIARFWRRVATVFLRDWADGSTTN